MSKKTNAGHGDVSKFSLARKLWWVDLCSNTLVTVLSPFFHKWLYTRFFLCQTLNWKHSNRRHRQFHRSGWCCGSVMCMFGNNYAGYWHVNFALKKRCVHIPLGTDISPLTWVWLQVWQEQHWPVLQVCVWCFSVYLGCLRAMAPTRAWHQQQQEQRFSVLPVNVCGVYLGLCIWWTNKGG